MNMKTKVAFIGMAIGATMVMAASGAQATVYAYDFETNDGGPVVSMIGTFTTAGPATPSGVEITAMTGTLYNSLDTVMSVISNPNYPGSSYSPDGAFIYDNAQYSTQPYLDYPGVLFTTVDNPTGYWNLFSNGSHPYDLYESVPGAGYPVAETGTLTIAAAPELSTWAMIALGFAGLGFAGYRKSRSAISIAV